ncbi:hypothetical protein V6N13_050788 [Hibiscus sabdariffa]
MNLDDLFEQKGKIAKAVLEELGKIFKRRFRNHLKRFRNHCGSKPKTLILATGSKMEDWGIDFGLENNEEDDVTKEIYHVTALVGQYTAKQLCKVSRRTSEQTGHAWVQEILQGHPIRCYEMF